MDPVDTFGYADVPEQTRTALVAFVERREHPGSFLYGMLTNDMHMALTHADNENLQTIRRVHLLIHNRIPAVCHGSKDAVEDWLNG